MKSRSSSQATSTAGTPSCVAASKANRASTARSVERLGSVRRREQLVRAVGAGEQDPLGADEPVHADPSPDGIRAIVSGRCR